ncbi:MAG: winged helix-turn-helix transcriptional regulator [Thermoplasmatota archaeon]
MSRDDPILLHSIRVKLFEHILSNPGVHFTELMEHFSLTEGTLRHHLRVLMKGRRIRSCLNLGRRCYYPFGYSKIEMEWDIRMDHIHLNDIQKKVLSIIDEENDINQKVLSSISGIGRFRLRSILRRLMELGFIRSSRKGKEVRYSRTSRVEIRKEVLRALVTDLLRREINEETYIKARKVLDEELF